MKNKKSDIVLCVAFCGFLGLMLALYLLLPKSDFSEKEKSQLAQLPALTWQTLADHSFADGVEEYLADHIPGRDFLVGVCAYFDLFTGRQVTKDIYVAEGDRLVEAPVQPNALTVSANMTYINTFAETVDADVDLMIVPSAGYAVRDRIRGLSDPYRDDAIIQSIYAAAGERVNTVDILQTMTASEDLYYRTDHHWTSAGAYAAYCAYLEHAGMTPLSRDDFAVEACEGFYGSTYSRSGLWLTKPEPVEMWKTEDPITVTIQKENTQTQRQGVFFTEQLETLDKYTVYLGGNHSLVRLENPNGQGKLLVIRDSYANCLGTLLAASYETVVMVDLRGFKDGGVSQLVAQEDFDRVLVCYSIGNFMTDANFPYLVDYTQ